MGRFGRGRSGGYGRGMGYWAGTAAGAGWGRAMGMGNPYPWCRFYRWMPRRWWAVGMSPYGAGASGYPSNWVGPRWT